ncbi:hypothetical protein CDV36_014945 [Fusarium kuroshium]|uniref:Uncharacterized protein n=1 Tax=Fusarium kuroshium TaxID=2010991 RepID=A0A3M2RDY9_9HYPO|nr:hypothetical protein CDV36_014945 [Fusarium kuroshium]
MPAIDVVTPITNWVTNKHLDIAEASDLPGGWEIWAQADINIWFNRHTAAIMVRSPNCYIIPAGQADFAVTEGLGYQDAVMEFKVWNSVSEQANAFARRLLADWQKVRTYTIAGGFTGNRFWSIGISNVNGQNAIQAVLNNAGAQYQCQTFQGFDVWAFMVDR